MFFDESAEYRLLGSFIDHPSWLLKVTKDIFAGDRQYIYDAMRQAYSRYGDVSSEGVERFYGKPVPSAVEMARGAKPSAIIDHLIDLATKRQIATLQNELTLALASGSIDRKDLTSILTLPPVVYTEDSKLTPGIDKFVSLLQQKRSGQYKFVSTGLAWMDHMLGGEWPCQGLSVIAGKSGGGKTALVCQSILNMARQGIPVYFASLEMPRDKLIARFVANMASIDGNKLKLGTIDKDEEQRANAALLELQSLPIYIEDNPDLTVENIVYAVKSHSQTKGIRAFFVDYLQLIGNSNFSADDNSARYYGYVCQQLRNVAVTENLSSVILSQQNRAGSGLDSLLGSGRIGNIADTVIELAPDDSTSSDRREYMFNFLKNREGMLGSFGPVYYQPRYLRFA